MNGASWLYLFASLWGAWFAYNAVFPRRRGTYLATWSFVSGWLTGDLAVHHIAWQAVATTVFAGLGAFQAPPGQIGLAVTAVSWSGLILTQLRSRKAAAICDAALHEALASDTGEPTPPNRAAPDLAPSRGSSASRLRRLLMAVPRLPSNVERIRNIQYGRAAGLDLHLDVYRPCNREGDCPVLLQIHGGGWMIENKDHQALPLMHRLASNGWICVSINYRLSPHATFPDHIIDTKRALAWVKERIARFGGNPDFVVLTGGSAGGHLSALTALTANDPEYQPGFEEVDTRVQGCIPFYGVYDFTGTTDEHDGQAELLEKYVMKGSLGEIPLAYDRASPIRRVGEHAPPFFVIHGDCDTLVPVAQARAFVRELRASGQEPVVYAELPGAQHVFDILHTLRTDAVVDAAERFANTLHERCQSIIRDRETANSAAPSRPRLRVV